MARQQATQQWKLAEDMKTEFLKKLHKVLLPNTLFFRTLKFFVIVAGHGELFEAVCGQPAVYGPVLLARWRGFQVVRTTGG